MAVMKKLALIVLFSGVSPFLLGGPLDKAWIKGETDKNPVSYKTGETMKFTLSLVDAEKGIPEGEYFLEWKHTDDFGAVNKGRIPLKDMPFKYETSIAKPGFVRLEAYVVDKNGKHYVKENVDDSATPSGRRPMNAFERRNRRIFFDGGAGAEIEKLMPSGEPTDFDEFWKKQFARLDLVPIKADRIELPCKNPDVSLYAVRVDCAGLRPVTGYLSIPKDVEQGKTYPCRLITHGYSGDRCNHGAPSTAYGGGIVFTINAHGLKLPAFGATDADTKALRWEVRSNGNTYAFDPKQNEDPEVAYFNGMVLRVKRALQYLKTVKGWNGRDLYASGGSQGGLQTIWAAGCGEGVTLAESGITWCCDMIRNNDRRARKISSDGWYIPWTPSMGYYDAAIFAKRIPRSCTTVVTRAGIGDYCCPPAGLAMMWNNMTCPKKIVWVQGSQHGYVPPEYEGRDTVRTAD
jgi:cephalosporin-C deacetylase-like acetyl esterase